jgi:hypothetical protein
VDGGAALCLRDQFADPRCGIYRPRLRLGAVAARQQLLAQPAQNALVFERRGQCPAIALGKAARRVDCGAAQCRVAPALTFAHPLGAMLEGPLGGRKG